MSTELVVFGRLLAFLKCALIALWWKKYERMATEVLCSEARAVSRGYRLVGVVAVGRSFPVLADGV